MNKGLEAEMYWVSWICFFLDLKLGFKSEKVVTDKYKFV